MSDVFRLPRGAAMSTLFFGHDRFPLDREADDDDRPHSTRGPELTPVTWLPARAQDDEHDDVDFTRGY